MVEALIVIFGSIFMGFGLIFLLAVSDKKKKKTLSPTTPGPSVLPSYFEKACFQIIEGMKLEIEEIHRSGNSLIDVLAQNPTPLTGGRYLIRCLYCDDPERSIQTTEILEFSNNILQERLSKGIFLTTGKFSPEISSLGELAPIEFVDGEDLEKLLKKYAPDYLVIRS